MNCPETRDRLSAWVDGELPAVEAEALRAHLADCPACAGAERSERAFLARVKEGGRAPAPEALRRRVETILVGPAAREERRGHRWALPLMAAAAAAVLLVLVPPARVETVAAALVADHLAHAADRPSGHPFPPEADPPTIPWPSGARLEGLSECTVDGRRYAHWVVTTRGDRVSVFVPLEEPPPVRNRDARAEGVSVVAVQGESGVQAFLVSSDVPPGELADRWGR